MQAAPPGAGSPEPLEGFDAKALLFNLDTALRINRRFQFFLWAQGGLQAFLPHEIMICAQGDLRAGRFRHELFARGLVGEPLDQSLADGERGLLAQLVRAWHELGCGPLRITSADPAMAVSPTLAALREEVATLGIDTLVAHGTESMGGERDSFFVLLQGASSSTQQARWLEWLLPHLHFAYRRMLAGEEEGSHGRVRAGLVLTERERVVLGLLRAGKSNREIGDALGISPFTIKNHVHSLLRKLEAANRTEAVAKGAALRLYEPE